LKDVIAGYIATGFRSIVILNGHYENESFIFEALELCREEGKLEGAKIIAMVGGVLFRMACWRSCLVTVSQGGTLNMRAFAKHP